MAFDEVQRKAESGISESEHRKQTADDPLQDYRMGKVNQQSGCLDGKMLPVLSMGQVPHSRPPEQFDALRMNENSQKRSAAFPDPERMKWMAENIRGAKVAAYDPERMKSIEEQIHGIRAHLIHMPNCDI